MSLQARQILASDIDALIPVIRELDEYYQDDSSYTDTMLRFQLQQHLFEKPIINFLVAADSTSASIAGFLSYVTPWPIVSLHLSIFMKELFVCQNFRNRQVAHLLIKELGQEALRLKAVRIDWTTGTDNIPARKFYTSLGIAQRPSKIFYRLEGDDIRTLACEGCFPNGS